MRQFWKKQQIFGSAAVPREKPSKNYNFEGEFSSEINYPKIFAMRLSRKKRQTFRRSLEKDQGRVEKMQHNVRGQTAKKGNC
jgi:hypothetical protein